MSAPTQLNEPTPSAAPPRGAADGATPAAPRRDRFWLGVMVGVPAFLHIVLVWIPAILTVVLSFTEWDNLAPLGDIRARRVPATTG